MAVQGEWGESGCDWEAEGVEGVQEWNCGLVGLQIALAVEVVEVL